MGKQTKQYDAQFKQDAVNYYHLCGKTGDQVAKNLKVAKSTLSKWIRDARMKVVIF